MAYEQEQGPRIISAGGNVYAMYLDPPKVGMATRGRGFWTGKTYQDEDNPNVDKPSPEGAQTLVVPDEHKKDGFEDDIDPITALYAFGKQKGIDKISTRQAKELMEFLSGGIHKSTGPLLTIGMPVCIQLLKNPDELSDKELYASAKIVRSLGDQLLDDEEQGIVAEYAEKLTEAIQDFQQAKSDLARAILTKPSEDKEPKAKKAKSIPKKAQETKADAKGKTQYKYPKKNGGKGPGKQPGMQQQQEEQPAIPPVEAQPVDIEGFATSMGITAGHLKKLAEKKSKSGFIDFFLKQKMIKKHNITSEFLGRMYDSLLTPPPQKQQPPQQAPAGAKPIEKSTIIFHGRSLKGPTAKLVKALVASGATDFRAISNVMQRQYRWPMGMVKANTNLMLKALARRGAVSFQ